MRTRDIRTGWYIVGKLARDKRPGRAVYRFAQFPTLAKAEAWINARAVIDPKGVSAGNYIIDGPAAEV